MLSSRLVSASRTAAAGPTAALFSSSASTIRPKIPHVLFLNAARLDYDNRLDFSAWKNYCDELTLHPVDHFAGGDSELLQLLQDKQPTIVVAKEIPIAPAVIEQMPSSVQLVMEAGTGYNNWPLPALQDKGNILLCNVPTYSTHAVAQMAMTYVMNFSASLLEQQRMLHDNNRANFTGPFTLPLHELSHQTLGLIGGAGKIGTHAAEIGLVLGMRVLMSSRQGQLPPDHKLYGDDRVTVTDDVSFVLRESDYVSLHTPLNDQTRGSFGRAQIGQMKATAYLINTSRGAVCNEDELIDCLREGVIAGAGLDVTTTEPPAMDSALWDLPNVWLSPHTGWRRLETRQRLVDMMEDNLRAYATAAAAEDYINVVNR